MLPSMRRVSDPEFIPPFQNPFPVGASPFRQKGNAFLGDIEYFATSIPGGYGAVLKAISDESTRAYLSQKFLASEWYDAFPNLYLQLAAARLRGISFEEHRRRTGAYHAEALGGVYRALLRVVSNENVATWGPRMASLYWDFGKTETHATGPREVRGIRRGTPKALLQWLVWAVCGFADTTLRLAGARDAITMLDDVESEGKVAGVEVCSVRLRMTWA
jgi:hypothetical protein